MHLKMEFDSGVGPTFFFGVVVALFINNVDVGIPNKSKVFS